MKPRLVAIVVLVSLLTGCATIALCSGSECEDMGLAVIYATVAAAAVGATIGATIGVIRGKDVYILNP